MTNKKGSYRVSIRLRDKPKDYVAAIEVEPINLSRDSMRNIRKTKLDVILERRRSSVTARLRRFINGRK